MKEKDNQIDICRARLNAIQAHHSTSEGALTSLEDAISDKDKQISNLREQRDRAEQERNEERDIHERQIAEFKMKFHSVENDLEKLQVQEYIYEFISDSFRIIFFFLLLKNSRFVWKKVFRKKIVLK